MAGGDASYGSAALDPNWINRKFEAIDQWQREMMPSVAQTVKDIVNAQVELLAHQVAIDDLYDFENPFSGTVGTTLTRSFYRTVSVPAGYTQATVFASAAASMYNGGAATEAIVACGIGTSHLIGGLNFDTGVADLRPFPASQWVQPSAVHMKALTGLDTDTEVAIALYVRTSASVTVTPGTGTVMATIIFTRG